MQSKQIPFGTKHVCKVLASTKRPDGANVLLLEDVFDHQGYVLVGCGTAVEGTTVEITFTPGGPLGGYWKPTPV